MGLGRSTGTATFPVRYSCTECGVSISIDVTIGKDYCFEEAIRYAENDLENYCNWKLDGHDVFCVQCRDDDSDERVTDWAHWISGKYRATVRDQSLFLEVSHNHGEDWLILTSTTLSFRPTSQGSTAEYDLTDFVYQGLQLRASMDGKFPRVQMSGS